MIPVVALCPLVDAIMAVYRVGYSDPRATFRPGEWVQVDGPLGDTFVPLTAGPFVLAHKCEYCGTGMEWLKGTVGPLKCRSCGAPR